MASMLDNARGNLKLLRTFLRCHQILQELPSSLRLTTTSCEFRVPVEPRKRYEAEVSSLHKYVVEKTPARRPADATLMLLVAQRALWISAAASQYVSIFVLVGLLQFVVAPYSFGAALLTSGMYFMTMCLGHLLTALVFLPLPLPSWGLELNATFIACFLLADFATCCYFSFVSSKGSRPKQFSWATTLQHMAYGTFNTKTYLLLVFLFCRGAPISLAWLVLDACIGIGPLVNNLVQKSCLSWECIFYNAHRLQHLRIIYEHAHKAHHRLHDVMAFDGHLFSGSGFPEEWFMVFYDIAMMKLLGVPPPCLTWGMLKYQLANKDTHQRKEGYEGEQYHEDHHTVHRANFGFARPLLDMYFNTCKGSSSSVQLGSAMFLKQEEDDEGFVGFRVQIDGAFDPGTSQNLPFWQRWLAQKLRGMADDALAKRA